MPWTTFNAPSLGLGILRAQLASENISCRVRHSNLFLLKYLRASTYDALATTYALNDFAFTHVLEEKVSAQQLRLVRERSEELLSRGLLTGYEDPDAVAAVILRIRDEVIPKWLGECLEFVLERNPSMVGFTCMFDQTIASVALAKLVRKALPDTLIVLGGYALEGPAGAQILQSFPWVDAVSLGDGENKICELARASVDRGRLARIPGLLHRVGDPKTTRSHDSSVLIELQTDGNPSLHSISEHDSLERSPIPDYDDFFADLAELWREHKVKINLEALPLEASRGCWWGERHHCVFCGIDDETMKYRSKSPARVLETLVSLRERYGVSKFRFADYILPYGYYNTLLPMLASLPDKLDLACELKANLNFERFDLLREAGFTEVQPGIESFSTPVLRRMDKGVSAIQNIQTLVLGRYNGITVHYNILFGFTDDQEADYENLLELVPLLYHLDPPTTRCEVQVTRFAPMHAAPERFGLPPPAHDPRYHVIFSREYEQRIEFRYDAYAYYFERQFQNSRTLERLYQLLCLQIDHWRALQSQRPVTLTFEESAKGIVFLDTRYGCEPEATRLGRVHAKVYKACALQMRSVKEVDRQVGSQFGEAAVTRALEDLISARTIVREDDRVLGLALPLTRPSKSLGLTADACLPERRPAFASTGPSASPA